MDEWFREVKKGEKGIARWGRKMLKAEKGPKWKVHGIWENTKESDEAKLRSVPLSLSFLSLSFLPSSSLPLFLSPSLPPSITQFLLSIQLLRSFPLLPSLPRNSPPPFLPATSSSSILPATTTCQALGICAEPNISPPSVELRVQPSRGSSPFIRNVGLGVTQRIREWFTARMIHN